MGWRGIRFGSAVMAGTVLVMGASATSTAQAQSYAAQVIYSFSGGSDGADPMAGLIRDAAGNLYGTTYDGGDYGYGTVFRWDNAGNETVLHSFSGGPDGEYPSAGLVRDAAGNLYGTTADGGTSGVGTVFKVDASGKETVLYLSLIHI